MAHISEDLARKSAHQPSIAPISAPVNGQGPKNKSSKQSEELKANLDSLSGSGHLATQKKLTESQCQSSSSQKASKQ